MASNVLAVATLNKISGIPADAVMNTFVFHCPTTPPSGAELDEMSEGVEDFYNDVQTSTFRISDFLSDSVSRASSDCSISFYLLDGHLDGSAHGSPIRVDHFTMHGAGDSHGSLPDEVAIVLSYHRDYGADAEFAGSTRPRARDRGRLYVGPLNPNALTSLATVLEPAPSANVITTIAQAGTRLLDAADIGTCLWMQWSRTTASVGAVTGGWVDNAFDTQRRRGNTATLRTAI